MDNVAHHPYRFVEWAKFIVSVTIVEGFKLKLTKAPHITARN